MIYQIQKCNMKLKNKNKNNVRKYKIIYLNKIKSPN